MKLILSESSKKEIFISIFQLLKSSSSIIRIIFKEDKMYIQGMDNSHIILYEVTLIKTWFANYELLSSEYSSICLDSTIFQNVLSITQENDTIILYYDGSSEPDSLHIDLENSNKGEYSKYFKIPLVDLDMELMNIPDTEYTADFSIPSKKITEITNQLMKFGGDTLDIKCMDEKIDITSSGGSCEMLVSISMDDLSEYSIVEEETVELSFSLNTLNKMCLTNKLTKEILFSVSNDIPMKIAYYLDNENGNKVIFYVAPKVKNDD